MNIWPAVGNDERLILNVFFTRRLFTAYCEIFRYRVRPEHAMAYRLNDLAEWERIGEIGFCGEEVRL